MQSVQNVPWNRMKYPNHSLKQQNRERVTRYYHNSTRQVNNCQTLIFWLAWHHTGQDCDSPDIEKRSLAGHGK